MESVETGIDHQTKISYHGVIDIENPYLPLAISMRNELETIYPLVSQYNIYKAPRILRQLDEKAYTPRVVSIGPIHYGREELKAMEKYKRTYLKEFLQRIEVSLEDFIKVIKEKEAMVRNCYDESVELNSDDFVKMILTDVVFIIEFLLRSFRKDYPSHDRLYDNPSQFLHVRSDLIMIENQLPFFILKDLFELANITICDFDQEERPSLIKITNEFFRQQWDFLGIEDILEENKYSRVKHLLHFLNISIFPLKIPKERRPKVLTIPSVTELYQAGVKFKLVSNKKLFQLRFNDGIMEIPLIRISLSVECMLKNLLAFEQCQRSGKLLNDYVFLLSYLINTPKDVKLLVEKEIILNRFGDNEAASALIHNIAKLTTYNVNYFCFCSLVKDLNNYCRNPWHKWRAALRQNYFYSPWASISIFAAVILLILTIIQAVCSILQVR